MTRPCVIALVAAVAAACGRKGPPLPPIVRVPAAPAEFVAERRGDAVEIRFRVPSANTDNTRPGNIERVDVYAYSADANVSALELVRRGSKIGTIDVKAPRDPNRTIDPDEPASDLEPLRGTGVDQGATTELSEELTPDLLKGTEPAAMRGARAVEDGRPLIGPEVAVGSRSYAAVGVSTGGRPGPPSRVASVPLFRAPQTPRQPAVRYDENRITVSWAADGTTPASESGGEKVLPSRPIALSMPATGFHVYEVRLNSEQGSEQFQTRLTSEPITMPQFEDRRIAWGAHRCYTVRAVETIAGLAVESEPSPPACETLTDTFPPAAPKGLVAVASEGAINLIWDPATEADLAGYLVLRRAVSSGELAAVTSEPIQETTFTDKVEPGAAFVYAIQAVDKAGNKSPPSEESTPEAAR